MSYLGVDLHTNSFTVCYQSSDGKQRLATYDIKKMDSFRKTLRSQDKIAVEATGNTAWFIEQVQERNVADNQCRHHPVFVTNGGKHGSQFIVDDSDIRELCHYGL